jgi:hypothetical protein
MQNLKTTNSNTEKDPDDWVSGDDPMTGAQASYLKTLCEQAGTPELFEESLRPRRQNVSMRCARKHSWKQVTAVNAARSTGTNPLSPGRLPAGKNPAAN